MVTSMARAGSRPTHSRKPPTAATSTAATYHDAMRCHHCGRNCSSAMEVVRNRSFSRLSPKSSAAATAKPCELALKAPAGMASPGWNATWPDSPVIQSSAASVGRRSSRPRTGSRSPGAIHSSSPSTISAAPTASRLPPRTRLTVRFSAPLDSSSELRLRSRMCSCAQRPTSINAMNAHRLSK